MNPTKEEIKQLKEIYKVGDFVCFEECWESEQGGYGDEWAKILDIKKDGTLSLEWSLDREGRTLESIKKLKDFLESFTYTIADIAYK